MKSTHSSIHGAVSLEGTTPFHNEHFGYTLYEEVIDPAYPEGPRAIAMHVPAGSLSKVWQLVEPDYSESIELLDGDCSLVVNRSGTEDWTTMPLNAENPTADDVVIETGDMFCIVANGNGSVVLSRPSKPFELSYEAGITKSPADELSKFLLAHVSAENTSEITNLGSKTAAIDTEHFDREGFAGDWYIKGDEQKGVNALMVDVHGRHPKKRILEGNTRRYVVLGGEGTFTLNGVAHKVAEGDMFTIEAGGDYEYEGDMKLFEFNVSPDNSFGDEKLE